MDFQYLKDKSYYEDIYDLHTIKSCMEDYWSLRDDMEKRQGELKDMTPEEFDRELNKTLNYFQYFQKGGRYKNKQKTLDEWMAEDKVKQDKLDTTPEPQNILCPDCDLIMKSTYKHLEDYMDKPLRVFFFFECPKCKKRKGYYDNGKERVFKPDTCIKCKKEAKMEYKEKGKVVTWTTTCLTCGHKEIKVDDFEKKDKERDVREHKDKELLTKYREQFCFSEKEGKEYIELVEAMEVANVVREEEMQKYDNQVYERSLQLKKTRITNLEVLLAKSLEKAKYIKLSFGKPDMGQNVIVPFTIQDADSKRIDRVSSAELEKLIKQAIEDANWRLVPNTVFYRLGFLEGSLKGYEREEDMLKLAGKKEEQKPKPKIDEAMRQKYASNNLVQLAKMFGKHDAIENIRKRRLKKEPDGFFLEATEGPLECGICNEYHPGNEIWWREEGLLCADCWRNVQEKVIPLLSHDIDNKIWIKDWEIHSDFNVHPMTARKLRRLGELHGHDLKRKNGSTYCTVYLVSENKEFLKKHPKKPPYKVEFVSSKEK